MKVHANVLILVLCVDWQVFILLLYSINYILYVLNIFECFVIISNGMWLKSNKGKNEKKPYNYLKDLKR